MASVAQNPEPDPWQAPQQQSTQSSQTDGNRAQDNPQSESSSLPKPVRLAPRAQVANPTFSPGAGSYTSPQTVTISTTTSGASIRYTTDGSTPSETAGTLYSSPITVGVNETVKAIAYKSGSTDSAVASAAYTIAAAVPAFSPAAGSYTSPQTVTISSTTSGASIRYTTNGSTPSETAGTLYSSPVTVGVNETVKAIAYKTGMADSAVASAAYTIAVGAPTFSPAAGSYTAPQTVTISSATSGASIRYTTNGSTPSETAGTLYSSPISVGVNETVKAIAYKTGMADSAVTSAAYTIAVAAPAFSPAAGSYSGPQTVTLSSATSGASIRYTTDGSTPSETAGTLYSTGIAVNASLTIKAIAYMTGMADSAVVSAAYTITPQVAAPTFSPAAGNYSTTQNVTISTTTTGASIRYTTDGSTPSETAGTLYSTPVAVSSNLTIKAIAYKTGMTDSAVSSAAYTITVAAPAFSPAPGAYSAPQSVTLTTTTSGASIRYTTDGSTPSPTSGTLYSSAIAVNVNTTIKAIAYETGLTSSSVVSGAYTIAVAVPTFSPAAGTYPSSQSVTITSATAGASIRYTTNGSTPSETSGTLYSTPVSVTTTTTIKAIAYLTGMADSAVVSATFTIAPPAAAPTFNPAAGTYNAAQSVTLRSTTSGATIRYTTDGTNPSETAGTVYTGAISVTATTTIKAIAYKSGFTDSSISSATYTINYPVATPTFSPAAGTYALPQTVTISTTTQGAIIRYTIDGSTPSETNGIPYSWPVVIPAYTTLQAIAYAAGSPDSSVSSATYQIGLSNNVSFWPTNAIMVLPSQTIYSTNLVPTVTGTPTSNIIWSAAPGNVGTCTCEAEDFAYTAPATFSAGQVDQLIATSMDDSTKSATFLIFLTQHLRVNTGGSWYAAPDGTIWSGDTWTLQMGQRYCQYNPCPVGQSTGVTRGLTVPNYLLSEFGGRKQPYYVDGWYYDFPVPAGSNDVTLHFVSDPNWPGQASASSWDQSGTATTRVNIPDTVTAMGGPWIPFDQTFTFPWQGGSFEMDFSNLPVAGIEIKPHGMLEIAPVKTQVGPYQTQQFSTGGIPVTYSINPPGSGTINTYGIYAAPASIPTFQIITLTATTVGTPTQTSTAQVYLEPQYLTPPSFTGVSPAAPSLNPSQSQLFAAVGNMAVSWSMSPQVGTLTPDGLYTAPANIDTPQTVTITATSLANSSQTNTAQISLVPLVTIGISPAAITMPQSAQQQFTATVTGNSNTAVTWSMSPQIGTLSSSGLYQAPSSVVSPQTLTVTATSVADPTKSASAQVTVVPPITVTLGPATVSLAPVQQQQFTALVTNLVNGSTAVTWTLTPPNIGVVSPGGLYTAPVTFGGQQTVTITAASQTNPAANASATITLVPSPVSIVVAPLSANLSGGQSAQFSATVANTSNTAVTWLLNPNVGSVSNGLYAAPASVAAQQTVTIYAISQADTTQMASAVVTLLPPPSSSLQLAPNVGQAGQFLHVAITGQGTHFVQGVTQAQFGPAYQVGSGIAGSFGPVTVTSPTTAIAQVSVVPNAMPGFSGTVTVQTGSETVSLANGFTTVGIPALSSFSPVSAQPGQSVTVTIGGNFTNFIQGITDVSFGPGVSVGGAPLGAAGPVTVTSATTATAQLTIDPGAVLGPRTPVAQTGSEQAALAGGFSLLGNVSGDPPVATLTAPAESQQVTGPTPVTGTITSPNLAGWVLEYKLADAATWTQFASGTSATVSATLDPTMMLNGTAQIRLTATDTTGQTGVAITNAIISGARKTGLFTLLYTDLNVPLGGIPIQVTRMYDSRNKNQGDFGIGWTLGLRSSRVTVNGPIGDGWQGIFDGNLFSNCMEATRPHTINVTLPTGDQYSFEVTLTNNCTGFFGGTPSPTVGFTPAGTTPPNATLTLVGITSGAVTGNTGGGPMTLMDMSETSLLDPDQWVVGLPNSLRMLLSRQNGLQNISDLNGNTVTFSPDQIMSSTGKSVNFSRDALGRVTTLADPAGNQISYTYDNTGNLTNVSNQINGQSAYTYDPTHLILTMSDPSGDQPTRNDYYPDGELASRTDSSGKTINYVHDKTDQQEIVTDRLGRITVNYYDAAGNIVRTTDPTGATIARTFDSQNNVLTETDPLGKTVTYTYDLNNNRLTATDSLGHTTAYTYDGNNRLLTITDALNRVTLTNTYDGNGNLASTRDTAGNTATYTHNSMGLPLTVTDAQNNVTSYQYDSSGRKTQDTDKLGHITTYTYDGNGNILTRTTTRTAASGTVTMVTSYQYDNLSRMTQITYPDGSTRQTAYDGVGRPTSTIDQLGHKTSYAYDQNGRVSTVTFPDQTTQQLTYDAEGNTLTVTDQLNRVTSYMYDGDNRLTTTTYADNSTENTTYDLAGQTTAFTDARGNTTQQAFDQAGRVTTITDALDNATTATYDAVGNRLTMTDARKNVIQYQYDSLNRLVKTTYPDGTYDQAGFDSLGRNTSKTDQALQMTQFAYDALGRLLQVTDALGQLTKFSYDEVGNRISQTDANSHVTTFQYDNLGRQTQRTLPGGATDGATYDGAGNIVTHTDFRGKTTTYSRDVMNRLSAKTPDSSLGEATVRYTYTLTGRRASMVDSAGGTTYTYDNRDRMLTKVAPQGTLTYTWDGVGNLLSVVSSNSNGTSTSYAYDKLNRVSTVADNHLGAGNTTYSYDGVGNVASVSYPNAVQSTYTYDNLNRLTNLTAVKGATLVSYGYTLGAVGNRTGVAEGNGRAVTYTYDALYRLTGETISSDPTGPNGAIGYTYDPVGNRLTRTSTVNGVAAATSTYDGNDHLTSDTYDPNGSTTGSGSNTYAFDFEGRLKQINSGAVLITYDGDGNRVGLSAGGVTTAYLVDTMNPTGYPQVLEEVVNSAVQRVYTYGLERIGQSQVINGGWVASFYGHDGQGSVRYMMDANGTVTDRYTYDAFGIQLAATGSTPNVYGYAGEAYDPATQLLYLRARYMYPASGRFWTMDPVQGNPYDPASLHKYVYAAGDPVNGSDPLGLFSMEEGRIVHQWIGLNFMADGLVKGMFTRRSGTGRGAISLGRILFGRAWSPSIYGFGGSRLFPDLTDINARFMLEIKPTTEQAQGAAQLAEYLRIANQITTLFNLGGTWRAGTPADFTPFPIVFCDTTQTCLAVVHPPDANGVITYDDIDLKPTLMTIALLGAAGILAIGLWALTAPYVTAVLELVITTAAAIWLWAMQATTEISLGDMVLQH